MVVSEVDVAGGEPQESLQRPPCVPGGLRLSPGDGGRRVAARGTGAEPACTQPHDGKAVRR